MKFQVPNDIDNDVKDSPRLFDTVPVIGIKRKHSDVFYDTTWVSRKRRGFIPNAIQQKVRVKRRGDGDYMTAVPKKRRIVIREAVNSGLLIQGRIIVPPKAGAWRLDEKAGDVNVNELAGMVGRLDIEKTWPQFSRLPPELRRLVWQHTWEHRVVTISRRLSALRDRAVGVHTHPRDEPLASNATRLFKTRQTRTDHWGVDDSAYSQGSDDKANGRDFIASTTTDSKPPVSLFVNYESRHETLLHFQTAFALSGNKARIYFNFSLDSLKLPRHHPLGLCFEVNDLQKLTSITIPELFPILPLFKNRTGPYDFHKSPMLQNARVPPVTDGTLAFYPEFDHAWQLLRWHFPNLREINLEPVSNCKLQNSAMSRLVPINLNTSTNPYATDEWCTSCHNLQVGASRRFRQVGVNAPYLESVFDACGFFGPPAYLRNKVVVGTVKKKGRQDENVTVTFWSIRHHPEDRQYVFSPPSPPTGTTKRAGRDNASPAPNSPHSYELECLAKSLERFLGPPTEHDYLALEI
ncbi:hypothetical protein PG985_010743 [Apiospora marii]|uniref:2EXR domain-containing protein n=1 Tax=Apiospora marii TaxID=335849 RepID=A0ABR1T1T9_9PEZI